MVTAIVAIIIDRRQRRDLTPWLNKVADVLRKAESGSLTTDETAREIIKALEKGALRPDAFQHWEYEYRFCPKCNGEVELVGSWSADEYNAFGGTMKCKNSLCGWSKDFSY